MKMVNSQHLDGFVSNFVSPKEKFAGTFHNLTSAMGYNPRDPENPKQAPFDVAIHHIPPGKANFPYHSHSAQFEFYHIISGEGKLRLETGEQAIAQGDAFMCEPGEAHQIINSGENELVYYVVADNPRGESCYYPDSNKWAVRSPEHRLLRSEPLEYFDGEEEDHE